MPGYNESKNEKYWTPPTHEVSNLEQRYVKKPTGEDKWMYTLQTTLLFLLISNKNTYELTNELLGKYITPIAINGCPTTFGLILHTIVFTLLLRLMMNY